MHDNDKRLQENLRVRKAIQDALLRLMDQKHISEISASELISEAGVARASYYRNYPSVQEVVSDYIERMNREISALMQSPNCGIAPLSRENMISMLRYYLDHRSQILLLYSNGFPELLQDNTDQYLINALGNMPAKSMERYYLYMLSGAICRVQIEWLKNNEPEPVEDFADLNLKFIETNLALLKY